MKKPNRISLSLFDEDLKSLINATAKIFPVSQEDINNNSNPNNYEFAKVGKHLYIWQIDKWEYVVADDMDISWEDIKDKPISYQPLVHNHDDKYYTKVEVDTELANKSDIEHIHNEHYTKVEVDTELANKSDIEHNHDGRYYSKSETVYTHPASHPASMITGLADVALSGSYADLSGRPTIPTDTNQLAKTDVYTKTEVDSKLGEAGYGDMLKATYDQNGNGIVDNAEKVNGFTVGINVPANAKFTDTVYTHPTTAGNKHIPIGGSANQILRYSASGTAVWSNENDTVYTHPANHPASIITQDMNNRFVTDTEKTKWNKGVYTVGTVKPTGGMWYEEII